MLADADIFRAPWNGKKLQCDKNSGLWLVGPLCMGGVVTSAGERRKFPNAATAGQGYSSNTEPHPRAPLTHRIPSSRQTLMPRYLDVR